MAATGTGKTIVAALDYKRLRERGTFGADPRLLFVAHRQEILKQSLGAFRQVLRDGHFGELYVDGDVPTEWRHVFASVQSLTQLDLDRLPPDAFDVVIVDEFHHAGAPDLHAACSGTCSRRCCSASPPRPNAPTARTSSTTSTATSPRRCGCGTRSSGTWSARSSTSASTTTRTCRPSGGRAAATTSAELEKLYTGNDARVSMVLAAAAGQAPGRPHACARSASASASRTRSSWRGSSRRPACRRWRSPPTRDSDDRKQALAGPARRAQVRALFAVDLFNEGVDLPEVDTLLFLRPTESALVFLQQLGRGLRRFEGKDCVTVLDFIGQAHRQFRFDLRYRAVTGATRTEVEKQIEQGFPFLPAGCSMQLDRVATDIVLKNIRSAIPSRRPAMERELRALLASDQYRGRVPSLREFLDETGLEVGDVYKSGCWSGLKRAAGVAMPAAGPHEEKLGDGIERLLHVEDPLRIAAYTNALASPAVADLDEPTRRLSGGPALRPDAVQTWRRTRWRTRSGCSTRTRPSSRRLASCCRCWTTSPTTSPIRWTRSWGGRTASRSRCTRATPCGTFSPPSAS